MAELIEELQQIIAEKSIEECEEILCHNKRRWIVTKRYGVRECDKEVLVLCDDCMEKHKRECKDWALGFLSELLPGEIEIKKTKKRGRPKNL